jgi:citrate lyase subunit beta/citryl-CoA lyase
MRRHDTTKAICRRHAGRPDGIVPPKCAGATDVNRLSPYLDALRPLPGSNRGSTRIVI